MVGLNFNPPNTHTNLLSLFNGHRNRGGYTLSIIAKFVERYPVQYIIRVSKPKSKPKGRKVDFVSNLEGFKNIGDLLIDLHHFAQEKLYAKDSAKLRELLTAENIKTFVGLRKAGRFSR